MEHAEYKALRAAFDKNVVIPDTIKGKKVTALGDKIFRWKDSIISITIGKNIKSIGTEAFDECTKLKTVNMEKASLTSLPKGCFFCCTALKEVVLPTKLTSLPEGAFPIAKH